jgi:hypothetical protein
VRNEQGTTIDTVYFVFTVLHIIFILIHLFSSAMTDNELKKDDGFLADVLDDTKAEQGVVVNSSGHVQELKVKFSLLNLAGLGLLAGSVWPAAG